MSLTSDLPRIVEQALSLGSSLGAATRAVAERLRVDDVVLADDGGELVRTPAESSPTA